MKFFAYLLLGLLSSCALERDVLPATAGPIDSLVRANVRLSTGKVKFNGPVTFQVGGTGNTATPADNRKAGRKGTAALGPGATVTRTGGTSWQLGALVIGLSLAGGAVGGFCLARRRPTWLPL